MPRFLPSFWSARTLVAGSLGPAYGAREWWHKQPGQRVSWEGLCRFDGCNVNPLTGVCPACSR